MKIRISSDSTCDLSPEILTKFNIDLLPLSIHMGEKSYQDGVDIFPADIFRHVDAGGELCTTSAINIADYMTYFKNQLKLCDAVIHICIGSAFSSCYQNACIAASAFENVYVIDSKNLSSGHGHVVYEAALMEEQGKSPEVIVDALQNLTGRIEASFILDRLDYMRKGGRCSAVAALGANLLKLKPCIEVIDGKMQVVKKYRGSFEKCIAEYVSDRLSGREDLIWDRVFITHPAASSEAVEAAFSAIRKYGHFNHIIETQAGCTVSSHCGPNTLGILFIRSK